MLLILAYQRAQVLKRPLRFKKLAVMLLLSIFILYLNHILISGTLYALDVYHIEIDTSLLRYYFWMTIVIIMLLVGVIAWLFDYKYKCPHHSIDLTLCDAIIQKYGGNYLSHLVYSGEQRLFL